MVMFTIVRGFLLFRAIVLAMARLRSARSAFQAIMCTPHRRDEPAVLTLIANDSQDFTVDFRFTGVVSSARERRIWFNFRGFISHLSTISSRPGTPDTVSFLRVRDQTISLTLQYATISGVYRGRFGWINAGSSNAPTHRSNPAPQFTYRVMWEVGAQEFADALQELREGRDDRFRIYLGEYEARILHMSSQESLVIDVVDFIRHDTALELPFTLQIAFHRRAVRGMIRLLRLVDQVWISADHSGHCIIQGTLRDQMGLLMMSFR